MRLVGLLIVASPILGASFLPEKGGLFLAALIIGVGWWIFWSGDVEKNR